MTLVYGLDQDILKMDPRATN